MTKRKNPPEDIDPKQLDVPTSPRRRRNRAKPEPSAVLQAGKADARARLMKRPLSPGVMFEPKGEKGYILTSPHSDLTLWELQLADGFGTRSTSVMQTFLGQLKRLVPEVWDKSAMRVKPHETELNAALAMVADIQPRNVTEAALAAQMVAIHWMQMRLSAQALNRGFTMFERDAALAGKLARTFVIQVEALAKLRGKNRTSRQSIKVRKEMHQHVHYHDHREGNETDGQPHGRTTCTVDARPTLPSSQPSGDVVPITSRRRKTGV